MKLNKSTHKGVFLCLKPFLNYIRKMTGKTETEMAVSLLAIVTGLVPEDIDELDIADFQAASKIVEKMQKGK